MSRQGQYLNEDEVKHIVSLLRLPDLSMATIARRMGCSTSCIVFINKKFEVRVYLNGYKWPLSSKFEEEG